MQMTAPSQLRYPPSTVREAPITVEKPTDADGIAYTGEGDRCRPSTVRLRRTQSMATAEHGIRAIIYANREAVGRGRTPLSCL
eukprot:scaffold559_cov190-Alexandrium_tamarense.AAC.43